MHTIYILTAQQVRANAKIFVIYHLCNVLPWAHFDSKLLCLVVIFYYLRGKWVALGMLLHPLIQGFVLCL